GRPPPHLHQDGSGRMRVVRSGHPRHLLDQEALQNLGEVRRARGLRVPGRSEP
ncbi:hypothetical protein, partial [Achromobacter phage kwar_LB4]